jgi:DNA phosphorothioation-associated putative methyltransferase
MNLSHLAAPIRKRMSPLTRKVINLNLLSKEDTHLDYGCGFGKDVEELTNLGYLSTGYDPYYFPEYPQKFHDVVTMNYVLNVIDSIEARRETLIKAWNLTNKYLIISTNIKGGKGCLNQSTKIKTFRKSFTSIELKGFIESTIGYELKRIDKDKFIVSKDGFKYDSPMNYKQVINKIEEIKLQGWIPPNEAFIRGYCTHSNSAKYYRIYSKVGRLPSKNGDDVKCLHIPGGKDGEGMKEAIAAMKRRDLINKIKFHCIEQSFLSEFKGFKKFDFLKDKITFYE